MKLKKVALFKLFCGVVCGLSAYYFVSVFRGTGSIVEKIMLQVFQRSEIEVFQGAIQTQVLACSIAAAVGSHFLAIIIWFSPCRSDWGQAPRIKHGMLP